MRFRPLLSLAFHNLFEFRSHHSLSFTIFKVTSKSSADSFEVGNLK